MSRYRMGDATATVTARPTPGTPGGFTVIIDEGEGSPREVRVHAERAPGGRWRLALPDGRAATVSVSRDGTRRWVQVGATVWVADEAAEGAAGGPDSGSLEAPMPGKVLEVTVAVGDQVTAGQTLMVIEAMKMEHAIKAPQDGVVAGISTQAGAMVEPGRALVELSVADEETGDG